MSENVTSPAERVVSLTGTGGIATWACAVAAIAGELAT
jgi:hypothetical protein